MRYVRVAAAATRRRPRSGRRVARACCVALALGALALRVAAGRGSQGQPRVNGVPDWVYQAFAREARRA